MRKKRKLKIEAILPDDRRIPVEIYQAAKDAGFTDEQIDTFTDVERLKMMIVQAAPEMAIRFIKPIEQTKSEAKSPVSAPTREVMTHQFTTSVLAGFGPLDDTVRREQEQITNEIRRRGIYHIQSIERNLNMIPDEHGKFITHVTIHYER